MVAGAELLVNSAVSIMHAFGVSEKFIGLTVVAFGTSLPELATSLVAAIKKEMDISIGNLVGSNVFNILGVLGAASMKLYLLYRGKPQYFYKIRLRLLPCFSSGNFIRIYKKNRHRGGFCHPFRHRAENHLFQPLPAMGSQDKQINALSSGIF